MEEVIEKTARRHARIGLGLLAALGAGACATLDGAAPFRRRVDVGSDQAAAACARIVRQAFPAADERPYAAGALVHEDGAGRYRIEVAAAVDGSLRMTGNLRLAQRPLADRHSLQVGAGLRVVRHSAAATATLAGARRVLLVAVEPAPGGAEVTVLGQPAIAERISATLDLAAAVRGCELALRAGRTDEAARTIADALDAAAAAASAPDPLWLARAQLAAAASRATRGDRVAARRALATAVEVAPDDLVARRALAELSRTLAQPAAAAALDRTLAVAPGAGLVALCSAWHLAHADVPPAARAPAWQARASSRLEAGDLDSARRHAQRARSSDPAEDGTALALLASIEETAGDHRLAKELRLCQALRSGFTPELCLALGHDLDRQGDPERAVRWLVDAWDALAARPEARQLMRDLVAQVGEPRACRVLASSRLAGCGRVEARDLARLDLTAIADGLRPRPAAALRPADDSPAAPMRE